MKWPRGKYNGRRIAGFSVKVTIDLLRWHLTIKWNFGEPVLAVGPVRVRCRAEYD